MQAPDPSPILGAFLSQPQTGSGNSLTHVIVHGSDWWRAAHDGANCSYRLTNDDREPVVQMRQMKRQAFQLNGKITLLFEDHQYRAKFSLPLSLCYVIPKGGMLVVAKLLALTHSSVGRSSISWPLPTLRLKCMTKADFF